MRIPGWFVSEIDSAAHARQTSFFRRFLLIQKFSIGTNGEKKGEERERKKGEAENKEISVIKLWEEEFGQRGQLESVRAWRAEQNGTERNRTERNGTERHRQNTLPESKFIYFEIPSRPFSCFPRDFFFLSVTHMWASYILCWRAHLIAGEPENMTTWDYICPADWFNLQYRPCLCRPCRLCTTSIFKTKTTTFILRDTSSHIATHFRIYRMVICVKSDVHCYTTRFVISYD